MDCLSSSTVGHFNNRLTSRRAPSWSLTQHSIKHGLRTTDYGLRTTDYGLRTTDYGLRTTDYGLRTTDYGLRTTDYGLRTGYKTRTQI